MNHVYTFPIKYIQIVVYHYNTEFHIYFYNIMLNRRTRIIVNN